MSQTDAAPSLAGGCLCGAVRYTIEAAPINVRCCHCRICQKAAGGPFFARAVAPRDAVTWVGETIRYQSSHRLVRVSCATCGALVFSEPIDRPTMLGVALSTLDDQDAWKPDMHIWTSSKVDWLKLDDGLPQHPEGVAY
jgi:hypothetical protein